MRKQHRIGLLHFVGRDDPYVNASGAAELTAGLAELGYSEGDDVVYLERYGDRDLERTQHCAEEIVRWGPDVVCTFITSSGLALKTAIGMQRIPVVCWATNFISAGLAATYTRPGGNFTGISYDPNYQLSKIRLLKLAIPGLNRVGHLYNPNYAPAPPAMEELAQAANLMGLEFTVYEALDRSAFALAVDSMRADGCRAAVIGPHGLFNTNGEVLGPMFRNAGIAAVGNQLSIARAGGLAAFGSPSRRWSIMARLVDRILKGEDPAEIPVDRSSTAPLFLNVQTAEILGLSLPASLIDEASGLLP